MSEYAESSNSRESIDEPYPEEEEEISLGEETEGEDKNDIGKSIAFFIAAGIIFTLFVWLLIGAWGYLQEMSYGHGWTNHILLIDSKPTLMI